MDTGLCFLIRSEHLLGGNFYVVELAGERGRGGEGGEGGGGEGGGGEGGGGEGGGGEGEGGEEGGRGGRGRGGVYRVICACFALYRSSEHRFPWLQRHAPSTPDPSVQLVGFGFKTGIIYIHTCTCTCSLSMVVHTCTCISISTVVLSIIGMTMVSPHYNCTFGKSQFQFQ